MKILVLGGTGTIGTPVTELLSQDTRNKVSVLCRNTPSTVICNVEYLYGDFAENSTRYEIKKIHWDVIIDLLWHNDLKYEDTYAFLSECTNHYIYCSSAAVYSDSDSLISEEQLRFIDANDQNRRGDSTLYHLQKSRMENVIFSSDLDHWSIIRPHITFNSDHLPLDIWDEKLWIARLNKNKGIVLTEDMLEKKTTYTYAYEVAFLINAIVQNGSLSFKQVYNVASGKVHTWREIIDVINSCIKQISGKELKLIVLQRGQRYSDIQNMVLHKADRLLYDRLLNRVVDTTKVKAILKSTMPEEYSDLQKSIYRCLESLLKMRVEEYDDAISLAYMDRVCGDRTELKYLCGTKQKAKYIFLRYFGSYEMAINAFAVLKKVKIKLIK